MRLQLIFIGKTNFPEMDAGIRRYTDRLRHYVPLDIHYLKPEKITGKTPDDLIRNKESERILNLIGRKGLIVLWDERGRHLDSVDFARFLEELRLQGHSDIWMVIGGPWGVSAKLREQAHVVLALSKMTFPHDIARFLVVEQLYRAFSILKGESYHKK